METVLSLKGITKYYPGVTALDDVSIDFRRGEVHALLGENGAGKSTLIKIISGAVVPDKGTIAFGNRTYARMTPMLSKECGVEVIYQEFNLENWLSVAENIYIGTKQGKQFSLRTVEKMARALFADYGFDMDEKAEVSTLSPAKKQIVEICKALSKGVKILVMDEPTAPLSTTEVERLFELVERLRREGVTVIYISHRLDEVFRITDRVTVLRDGRFIKTMNTSETNRRELVNMMVGRELSEDYPCRSKAPGKPALEVEHLTGNSDEDISFTLHSGEILGVAGLVGSGRSELAQLLAGVRKPDSGVIRVGGQAVSMKSPSDAIRFGIGLIPEDRKELGLVLHQSIKSNISMASIRQLGSFLNVSGKKENALAEKFRKLLNIRLASLGQEVQSLSGGNQQKVVVAKELAANLDILLFDEPTRGIDVGAKQEIYKLMNDLAEQGKAILMISSDMEELLGMSDRLIVMYNGRLAGEIPREKFSQSLVLTLASGFTEEAI